MASTAPIVLSQIVNGVFAGLLPAGIGGEQMGAARSLFYTATTRQPFSARRGLAIAKSCPSRVPVLVRAGEPFGAPFPTSQTPSAVPLHAVPTQTGSNASMASFSSSKMADSLSVPELLRVGPALDALETLYKGEAVKAEKMKQWVEEIRGMFRSMNDGEISTSPYDTAWVALVPTLHGSHGPQFPKCLQWIIDNQFVDGSWGDSAYFSYYDRVCSTLSCVVALQTWNTGPDAVQRGVKFIQQYLHMMDTEEEAHMTIGFEIVFPALISEAQKLGVDLPYEDPIIMKISAKRQRKLKKCVTITPRG